jgi:hypothetical protein
MRCFNWHIPLGCEEVKFGLTHNFWLWRGLVHHFFHLFLFFIHFIFQVARMLINIKGLKDWIQIKNRLKWYKECGIAYCFNSLWKHTFWKWTHGVSVDTYLLVVNRFYSSFYSSFFICHSFLLFILGHVAKYSSMSCNILCHVSMKYSPKKSILLTCSCSLVHVHTHTLTK